MPHRNIDPCKEHMDGSGYTLGGMTPNTILFTSATYLEAVSELCLPRLSCGPGGESFHVQGFLRTQFPDRECFRIATTKSPEQVIQWRAGTLIYLQKRYLTNIFTSLLHGLRILGLHALYPTTSLPTNVVYLKILQI